MIGTPIGAVNANNHEIHGKGELIVDKLFLDEKLDKLPAEVFSHPFKILVRQVVKCPLPIEFTFQDQSVPMGVKS